MKKGKKISNKTLLEESLSFKTREVQLEETKKIYFVNKK